MARADDLIDTHQHVWDLAAHDQPWLALPGHEALLRDYTEADLRAVAEPAGVAATVVVQTVTEPGETSELLAVAAGSDLIAAVVGWVDLQSEAVADELAALRDRPDGDLLRGIRHPVLIEDDPQWLVRPAVLRGLAAVGAAGLRYDLVVPQRVLPAAVASARAVPEATFVLDHCGNPEIGARPDPGWEAAIGHLGALPNTVCKLSGILGMPPPHTEPAEAEPPGHEPTGTVPGGDDAAERSVRHLVPYVETVLAAFGPQRLMFGSDWPVCTLSSSYSEVLAAAGQLIAHLTQAEQAEIMSGTARRIYLPDLPRTPARPFVVTP